MFRKSERSKRKRNASSNNNKPPPPSNPAFEHAIALLSKALCDNPACPTDQPLVNALAMGLFIAQLDRIVAGLASISDAHRFMPHLPNPITDEPEIILELQQAALEAIQDELAGLSKKTTPDF